MIKLALVLGLAALAIFVIWRVLAGSAGITVLNRADSLFGGSEGTRLVLRGERYGAEAAQHLEVIAPAKAPGPLPVLVFIHGGGWRSGSPEDYHFVGRTFARAGYLVVLPGYRLDEAGRFPHMLEDSAAAVAWTRTNAARLGGDPDRVFAMGHSAGAYNVMMLALDRQWLDRARVPANFLKGVVGLSGPYDFYPFTSDYAQLAFGHAPVPAATQPINFARPDAPPLFLLHGTVDTLVKPRNSLSLARTMTAAGVPQQAVLIEGMSHEGTVITLAWPFSRDTRVRDRVLAFLASHGGVPSAPVQAVEQ